MWRINVHEVTQNQRWLPNTPVWLPRGKSEAIENFKDTIKSVLWYDGVTSSSVRFWWWLPWPLCTPEGHILPYNKTNKWFHWVVMTFPHITWATCTQELSYYMYLCGGHTAYTVRIWTIAWRIKQWWHSQLPPIARHFEATERTLSTHGIVAVHPRKKGTIRFFSLHQNQRLTLIYQRSSL